MIHTAAQPSHDWAVRDPFTDFDVNAGGTLNVLQNVREHCIEAPVIHCSTNKVYGDRPNSLPLVELETRWEIEPGHPYEQGIREDMSIDACLHSVFGASKVAADVMVQEYGRYFGMKTACFRGGTLTGPAHSATELHGFLGYVMRANMERRTYKIFGYQGKQVRDAIHSSDVVSAFEAFFRNPRSAAVYNLGGGRHSNISHCEAFALAQEITGQEMISEYVEANRIGDHKWWIGSNEAFQADYPDWKQVYDVPMISREIYEANVDKWVPRHDHRHQAERARRAGRRHRLRRGHRGGRGRGAGAPAAGADRAGRARRDDRGARPGAQRPAQLVRRGHPGRPAGALGAQPAARRGPHRPGLRPGR